MKGYEQHAQALCTDQLDMPTWHQQTVWRTGAAYTELWVRSVDLGSQGRCTGHDAG